MRTGSRTVSGIALVFVSGLLALLFLVATAFWQAARLLDPAARGVLAGARADLAAESGMGYAAARLSREETSPPAIPAATNRGDDWSCRASPSLGWSDAALANPSWSHGEPWDDADQDGACGPGEARGADLDGDGRFSAWTGRLRGNKSGGGVPFSLKVSSTSGGLPVNAGQPDGPACRDPDSEAHKGLVHALNNLGAIRLLPNPSIGRFDAAGGNGDIIPVSRLGFHLIGNRPVGGYRSIGEIRVTLQGLGYSLGERDAVLPFLEIGPYETADTGKRTLIPGAPPLPVDYVPVELAAAPREILQALWMHLRTSPELPFPGQAAIPLTMPFPRSGGAIPWSAAAVQIYRDEAEALAAWAAGFRRTPGRHSWLAFREGLVAASLFPLETGALAAIAHPAAPRAASAWARAKADLAFFAMTQEGPELSDLSSWTAWGIDPGPGPVPSSGARPFAPIDVSGIGRVVDPDHAGNFQASAVPYGIQTSVSLEAPLGLTLAPPTVFRVASLGGRTGRSGVIRAADRIEFTTQADFEFPDAVLWGRRGLTVDDPDPAGRRPAADDPATVLMHGFFLLPPALPPPASGTQVDQDPSTPGVQHPRYPWIMSLPRCNARGIMAGTSGNAYSRIHGALALAGRACGNQGAAFYWPFTEDETPEFPDREWLAVSWPDGSLAAPMPPNLLLAGPDVFASSGYTAFTGAFAGRLPAQETLIDGKPYLKEMCVEAWFSSRRLGSGMTCLEVKGDFDVPPREASLRVDRVEPVLDPGGTVSGVRYTVFCNGWELIDRLGAPLPLSEIVLAEGFMPFVQSTAVQDGQDHLVFTIRFDPVSWVSYVDLYVNGRHLNGIPAGNNMRTFGMRIPSDPSFRAQQIDEIRLHPWALSQQAARERRDLGRFVVPEAAPAVYRSPRFVFARPAVLGEVNWTGIPTGFSPERVVTTVRLHLEQPGLSSRVVDLPETRLFDDLSDLGDVSAFSYDVSFRSLTPGPLYRTPYFEGISLVARQTGRAGRWLARD